MKKRLAVILVILTVLLSACSKQQGASQGADPAAGENKTVGICLPGTQQQWQTQAEQLTQLLEEAGCQVLTEYAGGDTLLQQSQVQTLLSRPVGCLVVAAVDSLTLSSTLDQAKLAEIPVVAYDRMLQYTRAATACVAVDDYAAGQQMARYIIEKKQLDAAKTPLTIEFFMGVPSDNNALWLYQGLMELLQPYLDSGKLQCRSGRTSFEDTCSQGEMMQTALEQCFDYLSTEYADTMPDILCTADDLLAQGCAQALQSFGYKPGEQWPLITGMGAAPEALQRIADGTQTMTLHVDTGKLVKTCADVVQQTLSDQTLTDPVLRSNGAADVPCLLLEPLVMDAQTPAETQPD